MQEAHKPAPNIVVEFVSDEDGSSLYPAVNIPANLSRENLESLLNKLKASNKKVEYVIALFQRHTYVTGRMTKTTIQYPIHSMST